MAATVMDAVREKRTRKFGNFTQLLGCRIKNGAGGSNYPKVAITTLLLQPTRTKRVQA